MHANLSCIDITPCTRHATLLTMQLLSRSIEAMTRAITPYAFGARSWHVHYEIRELFARAWVVCVWECVCCMVFCIYDNCSDARQHNG
jgi:hypothetical protein